MNTKSGCTASRWMQIWDQKPQKQDKIYRKLYKMRKIFEDWFSGILLCLLR